MKRATIAILVAAKVALVGAACATEPAGVQSPASPENLQEFTRVAQAESDVSEPSSFALTLSPFDGSTSTRNTNPYLSVFDSRERLPDDVVRSYEAGLQLTSESSGDVVDGRVVYLPPDVGRGAVDHRFEFVPSSPLGEGWYRFAMPIQTTGVGPRACTSGEEVAVRFRPDSHPVVQRAAISASDDMRGAVLHLQISERVIAPSRLDVATADGYESCSYVGASDEPQSEMDYSCRSTLAQPLEIVLPDSMQTIDGSPVFGVEGEALPRVAVVTSHGANEYVYELSSSAGCRMEVH